jgi:hypothetical protein
MMFHRKLEADKAWRFLGAWLRALPNPPGFEPISINFLMDATRRKAF